MFSGLVLYSRILFKILARHRLLLPVGLGVAAGIVAKSVVPIPIANPLRLSLVLTGAELLKILERKPIACPIQ
jgi:hypothetical protein